MNEKKIIRIKNKQKQLEKEIGYYLCKMQIMVLNAQEKTLIYSHFETILQTLLWEHLELYNELEHSN